MCASRQYPYSPNRKSLEIPRERGVIKAKLSEERYEAKLECPGGEGEQNKNFLWEEYRYFQELHSIHKLCAELL